MRIAILESAIYIVATPIGNLGDITQRAIDVLTDADVVAAEDTRHTRRLLEHLGLKKEMLSLHDHNERQRVGQVIEIVQNGGSLALVSDAGTPLISDPGYVLVSEARAQGVKVVPVPGACAIIAALSASGLSCAKFSFEGFLPAKQKAKAEALSVIEGSVSTHVFYESTHRIVDTLKVLSEVYPVRRIAIAREITKTFETFIVGTSVEVCDQVLADHNQQKGEFVLIVEAEPGSDVSSDVSLEQKRLLLELAKEMPPKRAAAIVAEHYDLNKKQLYQMLIEE